jgi:hypothetical protein
VLLESLEFRILRILKFFRKKQIFKITIKLLVNKLYVNGFPSIALKRQSIVKNKKYGHYFIVTYIMGHSIYKKKSFPTQI